VEKTTTPVALWSVPLTEYNSGDLSKNETSWACSTYGEMTRFWWENMNWDYCGDRGIEEEEEEEDNIKINIEEVGWG
jgi:hypothetical protein